MANVQPRTLSGFMELLPARQVQFDRMVSILRETYSLYGFTPLDTPLIEASEVLLAAARRRSRSTAFSRETPTCPSALTSPSPWPSMWR